MKCIKYILAYLCIVFAINLSAESDAPYIYILGVTQDAGYPQAGCYQAHCMQGWENDHKKRGAVSLGLIEPAANKKYMIDATPNFPEQLFTMDQEVARILKKPLAKSDAQLDGVFLTHAHIGHYTGLMFLGHEAMGANNVPVYAMPKMTHFLQKNGPWSQLVEYKNISLKPLRDKQIVKLNALSVTPFLVPHRDEFSETVGYTIKGPNKSALFIPDINKWTDWDTSIVELVAGVDYALLDAAFYADGELPGRDMSKIPHPFASDTMALFDKLPRAERNKIWFIHMNHTNPLLDNQSKESQYVQSLGYHIAKEGVRLDL